MEDLNIKDRIIEVDKVFYSQLLEYLEPHERFMSNIEPNGLCLWTIMPTRKLVFIPEKENNNEKNSSQTSNP